MNLLMRIAVFALVFGVSIGGYGYWKGEQLSQKRGLAVKKWEDQVSKVQDVLREFDDAIELAYMVPHDQMGAHVEKLQAINRVLSKTSIPPCFDSHEELFAAEALVSVHLNYFQNADKAVFIQARNEANWKLRDAKHALARECSFSNILSRVYETVN